MRIFALILCVLLSEGISFAQTTLPIDSVSGKIRYEKILTVDNVSKTVLFERANIWLAKEFVDSQEVIQYSNQETGKILGKGLVELNTIYNGYEQSMGVTRFTIEINTKDGKARIVFTDLTHAFTDGNPSPEDLRKEKSRPIMKSAWSVIKEQTDKDLKALISSFEKGVSEAVQDDW